MKHHKPSIWIELCKAKASFGRAIWPPTPGLFRGSPSPRTGMFCRLSSPHSKKPKKRNRGQEIIKTRTTPPILRLSLYLMKYLRLAGAFNARHGPGPWQIGRPAQWNWNQLNSFNFTWYILGLFLGLFHFIFFFSQISRWVCGSTRCQDRPVLGASRPREYIKYLNYALRYWF